MKYTITIGKADGNVIFKRSGFSSEEALDLLEAVFMLSDPKIKEEDEKAERDEKPIKKKKEENWRNKPRKCKNCGRPGHSSRTCENTPKKDLGDHDDGSDETVHAGGEEFEVTEDVRAEINGMLLQGQGSREVADIYEISIALANKAIAKTKGFIL